MAWYLSGEEEEGKGAMGRGNEQSSWDGVFSLLLWSLVVTLRLPVVVGWSVGEK
jgi:hypothetical protein